MAAFYSFNDISTDNNIECSKCAKEQYKLLRCKCCNETITINDLLDHLKLKNDANSFKLVKVNGLTCLKLNIKNIYNITKFFKQGDIFTTAVNFSYKTNYIENKTNTGDIIKGIRNIEILDILNNFKQDNIDVKHLVMCPNAPENCEVLINIENMNVAI